MRRDESPAPPSPTPRRPYEPPEVRRISLVPAEMAATGCKTLQTAGRFGRRCQFGVARCSSIGS